MSIASFISRLFRRRPFPDIPAEWAATGGEGVTVCVIDTGTPSAPSLRRAIDFGQCASFVPDGSLQDENGHATEVCGVITGLAPQARLACFRVTGADGHGETTPLRLALEAAAAMKPGIVNVSLSLPRGASKMRPPIDDLFAHGIAVICGAGNTPSEGVGYPAKFPSAVCVGACDSKRRRARFSADGPEVDVLMPGVGVKTIGLGGVPSSVSGTSVACAYASGVAALWLSWWRAGNPGKGPNPHVLRAALRSIGA